MPTHQNGINTYQPLGGIGENTVNGRTINYEGSNLKPDAYFDKMLLKMLRQLEFHYMKYATEKSLPRNFSDTINWRRFIKLSPNLDPLQEARTPEGRLIRGTSLTATIAQYGDVMYFSDLVDVMQLDDVKREYTVELGYLAKETLDTIVRNTLVAEGSVYFPEGVTSTDDFDPSVATHGVSVDDIRKITIAMKRAHLGGSRKAGNRYVALLSPEIMYDLFDDNRMQTYMQFGQTNKPFSDGMIVDMFGIRFEEVLNAPVLEMEIGDPGDEVQFEIHDTIVIGEEGYAVTKLEGAGIRIITKSLGSAGTDDALDQRQSIGWKITGFGAKVLNQEAVVNYWTVPSFYAGPNWSEADITAPITAVAGDIANFWLKDKQFIYFLASEGVDITNTVISEDSLPAVTAANNGEYALVLESAKLFEVVAGAWVEVDISEAYKKYKSTSE